jgi:hypothetical protein
MRNDQFALDVNGLESIRNQMEKCFSFVKNNQRGGRLPTSADPTQAAGLTKDQFSLMAQKNTGLRVEDLKPPPSKQRKQTAGASGSSVTGSPNMPSPSTPQTESESPPKDRATPRTKAKAARGKKALATPGDSSNAGSPPMTTMIKTDSPRYAASPLSFSMTSPAPMPPATLAAQPGLPSVVEEIEPLSKKRQREAEEALADPDAFIEKTLLGLDKPLEGARSLAKDLGVGPGSGTTFATSSAFNFEPQLPPVVAAPTPISFASFGVLAAANAQMMAAAASSWGSSSSSEHGRHNNRVPPTSSATGTTTPFDFELYIDPSAAGFDIDDAPTPDLGSDAPGEPSPPSDDELDIHDVHHNQQHDDKTGVHSYIFGTASGQDKGRLMAATSGTSPTITLPATFSWSAGVDELPLGTWAIHSEL